MRIALLGSSLLVVACGGGHSAQTTPTPSGTPPPTALAVVQEFMQAVADSNLDRMSELWGTERGPARSTGRPEDFRRRVIIMHSYLRNGGSRVVAEREEPTGQKVVTVELTRPGCVKSVPFTLIAYRQGWLINAIELDAAGSPLKPCGASRP